MGQAVIQLLHFLCDYLGSKLAGREEQAAFSNRDQQHEKIGQGPIL